MTRLRNIKIETSTKMEVLITHQPSVPLEEKLSLHLPPSMNMGTCDYPIQLTSFFKTMASVNLLQPIIQS